MSLQATESSVVPPVSREALPNLSNRTYRELVKVAARLAIPLDAIAEYIFGDLSEKPSVRALEVAAAAARAELRRRAEEEEASARSSVPCRRGGRCPRAFSWRGITRCGCEAPTQARWSDL